MLVGVRVREKKPRRDLQPTRFVASHPPLQHSDPSITAIRDHLHKGSSNVGVGWAPSSLPKRSRALSVRCEMSPEMHHMSADKASDTGWPLSDTHYTVFDPRALKAICSPQHDGSLVCVQEFTQVVSRRLPFGSGGLLSN